MTKDVILEKVSKINIRGAQLYSEDNVNSALEIFKVALEMTSADNPHHTRDIAIICNNIGVSYDRQGRLDEAQEFYHKKK